MTVLKVGFVGIRSDRLDETVALFRDVIGVPVTRRTDDLVGFRLADGTVLELYGPTNEFHAFPGGRVPGRRFRCHAPGYARRRRQFHR
jgi:hypothetical protein